MVITKRAMKTQEKILSPPIKGTELLCDFLELGRSVRPYLYAHLIPIGVNNRLIQKTSINAVKLM
jgi:hypothetical protein